MPNQTPVQLAWVTNDLDATDGAPTVALGAMTGGMRFAQCAADDSGVPCAEPARAGSVCIELAHVPPDVQTFFDHVKQEQS